MTDLLDGCVTWLWVVANGLNENQWRMDGSKYMSHEFTRASTYKIVAFIFVFGIGVVYAH